MAARPIAHPGDRGAGQDFMVLTRSSRYAKIEVQKERPRHPRSLASNWPASAASRRPLGTDLATVCAGLAVSPSCWRFLMSMLRAYLIILTILATASAPLFAHALGVKGLGNSRAFAAVA